MISTLFYLPVPIRFLHQIAQLAFSGAVSPELMDFLSLLTAVVVIVLVLAFFPNSDNKKDSNASPNGNEEQEGEEHGTGHKSGKVWTFFFLITVTRHLINSIHDSAKEGDGTNPKW